MAKPTVLQILLGRPSQTYSFPQERKDYHSTKSELLRVATDQDQRSSTSPENSNSTSALVQVRTRRSTISQHLNPTRDIFRSSPHSSEDDEDQLFFTPNTSPRLSMLSHASLSVPHPPGTLPSHDSPSRSTTSLESTTDEDFLSDFLSDFSFPASDGTRLTSPLNSDYTSNAMSTVTSSPPKDATPARHASTTSTASEDWSKDVRWLVPPTGTVKRKSTFPSMRPSSSAPVPSALAPHLQSAPLTQLSQRIDKYGSSSPSTARSKEKMKAKAATGVIMTSVLEEDESDADRSVQRNGSTKSVLRAGSASSKTTSLKRSSSSKSHGRPVATPYSTDPPSLPSNGTPGFTSLILPRAPPSSSINSKGVAAGSLTSANGKVDLTRSGLAQTTMATVEVCRGVASQVESGFLKRSGSLRMKLRMSSPRHAEVGRDASSEGAIGFMGYRSPPSYVPSGSLLVQVWAVGLDVVDARVVNLKIGERPLCSNSSEANGGLSRSPTRVNTSSISPPISSLGSSLSRVTSIKSNWGSKSVKENQVKAGKLKKRKQKTEVGFIPGRSFVGRVVECGWEVKESEGGRKGEWVVGLVELKKCGALAEFIVVDRHRLHRVPHPLMSSGIHASPLSTSFNLTLEDLALLPLFGVPAYRAVRTFSYALPGRERNGRILVLGGASGAGALSVGLLKRRGWRVTVFEPRPVDLDAEEEETWEADVYARVSDWGAKEVLFDDDGKGAVGAMDKLRKDGNVFDAILDTIGGKEIWEAGARLLLHHSSPKNRKLATHFTTVVGDAPERPIPSTSDHFRAGSRTRKGGEVGGGHGKVGYAWVSVSQDVDWEGEDVRGTIEMVLNECVRKDIHGKRLRPWVEKMATVPLENAPEVFSGGVLEEGGVVVKIVG